MAKDKKKKKKEKKGKKKESTSDFASALSNGKGGDQSSTLFQMSKTKMSGDLKQKQKQSKVGPTLKFATRIGRSVEKTDKLYVGTDLREIQLQEMPWADILANVSNWTPLPFTHGIEMELIICDDDGNYPPGDEMVYRMKEIVMDAIKIMNEIIAGERQDFLPMPEYIRNKITQRCYGKDDIEKGHVMNIAYNLQGTELNIDSFGRDGNVTAITYILELVTPPCEYAEELAYWASTLFLLAKQTLPRDLHIVASAINPATKEYQRGLSQGDHHHLGTFLSEHEKIQAYCMIRNFIPHLIALSTNSPIINNSPTDVVKIVNNRITAPNCIRSLRLKNNTTMLSSNDPRHFMPYLSEGGDNGLYQFLHVINKASKEDGRFQDVFPFTDWNTIEIRVMDAQISICRRIGLGMLLQALCYKARKLTEKETWVPDAGPETLAFNRQGAIQRGLISLFKPINLTRESLARYDPEFAEAYLGPDDNPNRYMFQAVQRMFIYIKDELKELGFLYSPFLKPVLQSVFGNVSYATPPITEAEYQLSVYQYKLDNNQIPNVLEDLIYFTIEYCQDPLNQPLTGTLVLPREMRE
jgi:hypothetical protein